MTYVFTQKEEKYQSKYVSYLGIGEDQSRELMGVQHDTMQRLAYIFKYYNTNNIDLNHSVPSDSVCQYILLH